VALGDGNLSNPNGRAVRLRVTCDTKYPKLILKIQRALSKAFPTNKVSIVLRHENYVDVSCCSNKMEKLFGWKVGKGSKFIQKVFVSKWILKSKTFSIKCLCGLIETDGSVYNDRGYNMVMITSIIPSLAQNVYEMILSLGFQPRIYKIVPNTKFNSQPVYRIRLSKNVEEFLKLVQPQKI
jgi:hypothetical protein